MAPSGEARLKAVVVNDTRTGRHYGCEAVMQALLGMMQRQGIDPIRLQPTNRPWQEDESFMEVAEAADMVIVNGEGSIHHAKVKARSLASIGTLCKETLKKPSILLNSTLYANDETVYAGIADFDVVYVRDHASVAECRSFGLDKVLYCPDLSMSHDFTALRGERVADPANLRVGYTDSVVKSASEKLLAYGAEKGLIEASIRFKKDEWRPVVDYARELSDLDLLITGRFHSVCLAISTRTPFLAIESNTPKITSVLTDIFGHADRVIGVNRLDRLDYAEHAAWTEAETAALDAFFARKPALYAELEAAIGALARPKVDA